MMFSREFCPVFSYILRQYENVEKQFSRGVFLFICSFVCFNLIGVVIAIPKSKAIWNNKTNVMKEYNERYYSASK